MKLPKKFKEKLGKYVMGMTDLCLQNSDVNRVLMDKIDQLQTEIVAQRKVIGNSQDCITLLERDVQHDRDAITKLERFTNQFKGLN